MELFGFLPDLQGFKALAMPPYLKCKVNAFYFDKIKYDCEFIW